MAVCLLLAQASAAWAAPAGLDFARAAEKAKPRQGLACARVALDHRRPIRRERPIAINCAPPPVSHEGFRPIHWVLDPDEPTPGPASRSIVVNVHELACAGGRNPIPYLQRPEVRYLEKAVVITLWIEEIGGPATCPANPTGRLQVKLPGPLGARQLYDGSTDPPRKVEPGEDPFGRYSTSTSSTMPLKTWGGPPSRSVMKQ
ncbi:MAG: hypothetical protein M3335_00175 [Actinomycetota bacterium]|nr:hypothetical protein [Actinomycetota bacterium]